MKLQEKKLKPGLVKINRLLNRLFNASDYSEKVKA